MNKKNNIKNKAGILRKYLFEQENVIAPSQTDPVVPQKKISLDQIVDKYLISYEKESIPTSNDYDIPGTPPVTAQEAGEVNNMVNPPPKTNVTGESRKKLGVLASLFEADEDPGTAAPADEAPVDAAGGDLGADPGAGGGDLGGAPPTPVIATPKINLNNYAMGIARLIGNYEALLNPKSTILNRAVEYIRVNYDEPTAKQFEEMLASNYDLRSEEEERDQSQAPFAAGALGGSGGAA